MGNLAITRKPGRISVWRGNDQAHGQEVGEMRLIYTVTTFSVGDRWTVYKVYKRGVRYRLLRQERVGIGGDVWDNDPPIREWITETEAVDLYASTGVVVTVINGAECMKLANRLTARKGRR
jgi:hypothetical protein